MGTTAPLPFSDTGFVFLIPFNLFQVLRTHNARRMTFRLSGPVAEEVLAEVFMGKGVEALRLARARALAQEALERVAHLRGGDAGPRVHLPRDGGRGRDRRRGVIPPAPACAPLFGGEGAQVREVARALVFPHSDDANADEIPVPQLRNVQVLEPDGGGEHGDRPAGKRQPDPQVAVAVGEVAVADAHDWQEERQPRLAEVTRVARE